LNVQLNEELSIRIYSFPMRYQPTDLPDRSHIGPRWNRYFLRSVQLVLQATHGVVSGEPEFYRAAFGGTYDEFEEILSRPHHMVFHRRWYERYEGRAEFDEYRSQLRRLSASQRAELLAFLSGRNPAEYVRDLDELPADLKRIVSFYLPLRREQQREIERVQRARLREEKMMPVTLASDEIVEDAGLEAEHSGVETKRKSEKQMVPA
jgi:hypothetical protein